MRRRKSVLSRNPADMKAAGESSFSAGQEACFRRAGFFFLTERRGNVIENKGWLGKTAGQTGMYMKTKEMSVRSGHVIETTSL
jgi:hypothetical protein